MSFRPRNYAEALEFINARRNKQATTRTIGTRQGYKGAPTEIRDQLVAHTDDPLSTYGTNPPPISFRQWDTNIATFYPDGSVAIIPHDSVSTRARMDDMGLPAARSAASMGLTKNQAARLAPVARVALKGFPYGVPANYTTHSPLLAKDKRSLHPGEGEPMESVYVEAEPGAHKRFKAGRRRLLKVLKQYHDMFVALEGEGGVGWFLRTPQSRAEILDVCLDESATTQYLQDEWLPKVLERHPPRLVAGVYLSVKNHSGLYDYLQDDRLWERKVVPSRELDKWL